MLRKKENLADIVLQTFSQGTVVLYICEAVGDYAPIFITSNIQSQLGYTQEEFLAEPDFWMDHIHSDDRERILNDLGSLFETDHHIHEYRFQHKDGSYRWMHDELTLVSDAAGAPVEIVGYWLDITERKSAEEELIKAKELAEQANEAKSRFLSRMSHEFRTPLSSVIGFAQILKSSPSEPLQPMQKKSVENILGAGQHLLDMVNDLLDLAAIEADKIQLQIEAVDLAETIQDSVEVVQPLAEQRGIDIRITPDDCAGKYVEADAGRLKQVLLNLMSNAVKYNEPGGSITLSCETIKTDALRINVTDTGPGIPETAIPTLFEPFSTLYLRAHPSGGTGIGLSITKRLVEYMGGHIGVTSEPGRGSTFWIELSACQPPTAKPTPTATTHGEGRHEAPVGENLILYIEDTPAHVKLVEAIVQGMMGCRLISAPTARLGLVLAQEHQPDVIVLDICLPDMDGLEVFKQLHANEVTRDIPVIAISANAMPRQVAEGLRAGFHSYLAKPINIVAFKEAIGELIQGCAS